MGYVFIALENGRSVFPVERRFDGPATEPTVCNAGPFCFARIVFRQTSGIFGDKVLIFLVGGATTTRAIFGITGQAKSLQA
jgi:hypothetical protein